MLIDYVKIDPSEIEETGDYDLEGLFIRLGCAIDAIGAKRVVLDTIEVLFSGFKNDAILRAELARLFRWLKDKGVTAIVTGERGEKSLTRYGLEEYVADCVILRGQPHGEPDRYPPSAHHQIPRLVVTAQMSIPSSSKRMASRFCLSPR